MGSDVTCYMECANQGMCSESTWNAKPRDGKKYLNLSDVPVYSPSIGGGVDITGDGDSPRAENSAYQETHFNLSNNIIHVSETSNYESLESDFVRIPKSEYEAIKNRVSAIENRISQEFGNMATSQNISSSVNLIELPCDKEVTNSIAESVQNAYERTLEESEKLDDSSTDQLARRLSKELRIRRSLEHKIIRSPSARKIGTIKRRSRENVKPVFKKQSERNEITRNMSWHLAVRPSVSQISQLYPRTSLRRGRPNTVFSGLPQPNPRNISDMEDTRITLKYEHRNSMDVNKTETDLQSFSNADAMSMRDFSQYLTLCKDVDGPLTRNRAQRACSFGGCEWEFRNKDCAISQSNIGQTKSENMVLAEKDITTEQQWQTAETFFSNDENQNQEASATGRASIAKLRSQNAGMVLERMKMFDSKVIPKVELSEKSKTKVDLKSKKNVQVPSVFGHNAASVQMQSSRSTPSKRQGISRIHQGLSNQRVYSSFRSKTNVRTGSLRETYKDSPKKIGTPRKKQTVKSPNGSMRRQKLKVMKSPSRVNPSPTTAVRRKHNSMKIPRDKVSTTMKANLTAPDNWLATEKENVHSPAETNVKPLRTTVNTEDFHSPAVEKSSKLVITPLKDNNRINKHSKENTCPGYRTPVETPYIKKPLLAKSPSRFTKTPQNILMSTDRRQNTPMKALTGFGSVATPIGSPKRQSPRLLLLKSRNIS